MFKKLIIKHKTFLWIVLFIIVLAYIINFFINPHTIILGGEYIFSFDDLRHVQNILHDPRSLLAQDNTNCFDCVDFFHYSRWYSLFKIGYHSISQVIHIHPFVFLILSMILTQFVSLYIFVRTFFKRFSWIPFLVAAFVFILYPYKYSLIIETHDGLLYSNMLLSITLLIWSFKKLHTFTLKKLILIAFGTGLLFSFFLNIDIAVIPIAFYTSIIIAIVYRKKFRENIKKTLLYIGVMAIPVVAINIPIFISLIQNGDSRHYEGYISFNYIDSFLSGLSTAKANPYIIVAYSVLFIFCFMYAPIKHRLKIWMLVGYLFVETMITGMNSPINIYEWIFNTLPLMDTLRATYRFMFFELVFIFIIVYFTLRRLKEGNRLQVIIFVAISMVCLYLSTQYIYTNRNYFFVATLPQEYFDAQAYLKNNYDKKVYFPPETPLFHSIITDYNWGNPSYNATILLYKNPYTSFLPLHNLIQYERYPYLLSPQYLELFYLTNLENKPEDIVRALELRGVTDIVLDKNYNWKQNYPNFNVDQFIKLTKVDKQFGNIFILNLPDKHNQCKKGYGNISLDYCTVYDKNAKLFGKTKKEFMLEVDPQSIGENFTIRSNSTYTHSLLDPILMQSFIDNRLFFGKDIMQIFGDQKGVFTTQQLQPGKYTVYLAIFKYKKEGNLFGNAKIVVRVGDQEVTEISPYNTKPGIYWEKTTLNVQNTQKIAIDIKNRGYVVTTAIPILEKR